jgi:prepilin-type N-terminal cleavage/methylation domain-containing protein
LHNLILSTAVSKATKSICIIVGNHVHVEETVFLEAWSSCLNKEQNYKNKQTMIKKTFARGFTLIELLVVIAIIGILASVVLASLNTARDKGTDAAVQSSINNVRAQANIFGSQSNGSVDFSGLCDDANINQIEADITAKVSAPYCDDDVDTWVFAAPLQTGGYICMDSTGTAETDAAGTLPSSGTACP